MKFRFTNHGDYRTFSERDISADDIKQTIRFADRRRQIGARHIAEKALAKGILRVVYFINRKEYIIATAYYL